MEANLPVKGNTQLKMFLYQLLFINCSQKIAKLMRVTNETSLSLICALSILFLLRLSAAQFVLPLKSTCYDSA